jgi:DNA-directed RNA polymerase specialized sigma24 family protein
MLPSPDNTPIVDLYQTHHSWLYNWLRGRMGCSHTAADLAQDTFINIIAKGIISDRRAVRYLRHCTF